MELFRNKSSLPFAEGFDLRHSANEPLKIYFMPVPIQIDKQSISQELFT